MTNNYRIQIIFFAFLVIVAVVLNYYIFKPYLSTLFLALVISVVAEPVYRVLLRSLKRPALASFVAIGLLFVVILIPLSLFGFFLFRDAQDLYINIVNGRADLNFIDKVVGAFQGFIGGIIPDFTVDVSAYAREALSTIVDNLGSLFSGFFTLLFQLFLMVLALFYLFRDGGKLRESVIFLSPLSNHYDEGIIRRLRVAVSSVVKGSLLIALIQGILTGTGFAVFGVPSPMLWGAVASITALIPYVGTAVVLVPGILYLFLTGSIGMAVGLVVWGVVAVGLVDNILGPILIERGLKIHPFLILLSVLGGLAFFGPIGFLAGPITLSLLFALLDIYPVITGEHKHT